MVTVEFRQGWGWLVLAALTISTIGDEITLLTLMFRTGRHLKVCAPDNDLADIMRTLAMPRV